MMKHNPIPKADDALHAQRQEGLSVVSKIMEEGKNKGDLWIAETLFVNAEKARVGGFYAGAVPIFEAAIEFFQRLGLNEQGSACICNLGLCLKNLGQYKTAIQQFEKALAIDEARGNSEAQSMALTNVGLCYDAMSEYDLAITMYERSMAIDRQSGDEKGVAFCKNNLGMTYSSKGDYDRAVEMLESAVADYERLQLTSSLPNPLINLGNVLNRRGAYQRSKEIFSTVEKMVLDKPMLVAKCYNGMGSACTGMGDLKSAIAYHHASLDIYRQLGYEEGMSRSLGQLAEAFFYLGEYQAAFDLHTAKRAIDDHRGNLHGAAVSCHGLAKICSKRQDFEQAVDLFEQAAALNERVGDLDFQQTIYINLAGAYFDMRKTQAARLLLQKARKLNRRIKSDTAAMLYHLRLSNLDLLEERLKPARYHARAAFKIAQKTGAARTQITALTNISIAWLGPKTLKNAYKFGKKALDLTEHYLSDSFSEDFSLSDHSEFTDIYTYMAVLTYEQGKNRESFRIMEMAKARVLSRQLGLRQIVAPRSSGSQVNYLHQRERELATSIHQLQSRQRDEGLSAENMREMNRFSSELKAVLEKLKTLDPAYYAIRTGATLGYAGVKRMLEG